jgi:hypothetical protein
VARNFGGRFAASFIYDRTEGTFALRTTSGKATDVPLVEEALPKMTFNPSAKDAK